VVDIWPALGTSAAFAGALWQTATSALSSVDSMRHFLVAQNQIIQDELKRTRRRISRFRPLKRRRATKAVLLDASNLLNEDELRLSRRYDQQAFGWSLVTMGAAIACTTTWVSFADGL
jgi:hypothetical protein